MRTGTLFIDANRTVQNLAAIADSAALNHGWMTLLYHAINDPSGYANVPLTLFQKHLDTLAARQNKLWITTFARASAYHQMRAAATLGFNGTIANISVYTLTDTLPADSLYDELLTLRIYSPNTGSVTQGGAVIGFEQQGDTIQFDARPTPDDIVVSTSISSDLAASATAPEPFVIIRQSFEEITVHLSQTNQPTALLQLYDLSGRETVNKTFSGETSIYTQNLRTGMYFVKVSSNNEQVFVKKVVVR